MHTIVRKFTDNRAIKSSNSEKSMDVSNSQKLTKFHLKYLSNI